MVQQLLGSGSLARFALVMIVVNGRPCIRAALLVALRCPTSFPACALPFLALMGINPY